MACETLLNLWAFLSMAMLHPLVLLLPTSLYVVASLVGLLLTTIMDRPLATTSSTNVKLEIAHQKFWNCILKDE